MGIEENLTTLQLAYKGFCWIILLLLAMMLFACLIRAIKGPRIADRIVSVNMMSTMVMVMISLLAFVMKESYLIDICLIYAMVSFLAVIVLTKVYMGVYEEKRQELQNGKALETEEPAKGTETEQSDRKDRKVRRQLIWKYLNGFGLLLAGGFYFAVFPFLL